MPRVRTRKPRPNRHQHFRCFWALVYREAAYEYLVGRFGFLDGKPARAWVWRASKAELHRLVARTLRAYPNRKDIP